MSLRELVAHLRTPDATQIVTVSLVGTPRAVSGVARALKAVTAVTGMRHRPVHNTTTEAGDLLIRLDATCYLPARWRA